MVPFIQKLCSIRISQLQKVQCFPRARNFLVYPLQICLIIFSQTTREMSCSLILHYWRYALVSYHLQLEIRRIVLFFTTGVIMSYFLIVYYWKYVLLPYCILEICFIVISQIRMVFQLGNSLKFRRKKTGIHDCSANKIPATLSSHLFHYNLCSR